MRQSQGFTLREVGRQSHAGNTQRRVLDFVRVSCALVGYPPTVREICDGLGLRSKGQVYHHLTQLARRGALVHLDADGSAGRRGVSGRCWVPAGDPDQRPVAQQAAQPPAVERAS